MRLLILASLVVASPALAQPVTRTDTCTVSIVRAPEAVRTVIEAWVGAEPSCTTSLELRVVATEDGLYLLARTPDGRVHERVVPDAQTAGVLVASWAADDSIVEPATPEAVESSATERASEAPGMAHAVIAKSTPPKKRSTRWLTLGGMVRTSGGGRGVRGEADLVAFGGWNLGLGLSISESYLDSFDADQMAFAQTSDIKAIGYTTHTSHLGRWEFRMGLGFGVLHTSAKGEMTDSFSPWQPLSYETTLPTAEASLLISRQLGTSWAISAGPVLSWIAQSIKTTTTTFSSSSTTHFIQRDSEMMLFAGLRRRL
jgi:hypothetical protein